MKPWEKYDQAAELLERDLKKEYPDVFWHVHRAKDLMKIKYGHMWIEMWAFKVSGTSGESTALTQTTCPFAQPFPEGFAHFIGQSVLGKMRVL